MKKFSVTIEDRMVFTLRTLTVECQTENEAFEKAEETLGRWERINRVEEVSNGT